MSSRASASQPAFYIHLGGTGIIAQYENLGELHPKVWSDVDNIDAIWSVPEATVHRNTELLIQDAWTERQVKTAVVCPPIIHGQSTGPGRVDSIFYPLLLSASVETGSTFYLGNGSNIYSRVHVEDVAQVFLKLIESAAVGGEGTDWGREVCISHCASHSSRRGNPPRNPLLTPYRATTSQQAKKSHKKKSPRPQARFSSKLAWWPPKSQSR